MPVVDIRDGDYRRIVEESFSATSRHRWKKNGSIRRECLNHVLVLGERHLRRTLARYFAYYHRARTHLSLDKDAPDRRPIEPPEVGSIVQLPEVGSLHHRYIRQAA